MLQPLPSDPLKHQEVSHYLAFLAQLPRGCYLASILDGTGELVRQHIADDFAIPVLPELINARIEAEREAKEARAKLAEVQRDLAGMRRELDRTAGALQELRRDARKLAGI